MQSNRISYRFLHHTQHVKTSEGAVSFITVAKSIYNVWFILFIVQVILYLRIEHQWMYGVQKWFNNVTILWRWIAQAWRMILDFWLFLQLLIGTLKDMSDICWCRFREYFFPSITEVMRVRVLVKNVHVWYSLSSVYYINLRIHVL